MAIKGSCLPEAVASSCGFVYVNMTLRLAPGVKGLKGLKEMFVKKLMDCTLRWGKNNFYLNEYLSSVIQFYSI